MREKSIRNVSMINYIKLGGKMAHGVPFYSRASWLFTQPFIQGADQRNIKVPRHWLLWREFTGEFPAQRANNALNVSIWWRVVVDHHFCPVPISLFMAVLITPTAPKSVCRTYEARIQLWPVAVYKLRFLTAVIIMANNISLQLLKLLFGSQAVGFLREKCRKLLHDDVIKWKHFPRYWPFVRGIHRSPVNSPHKGQWRGALMFSLISV